MNRTLPLLTLVVLWSTAVVVAVVGYDLSFEVKTEEAYTDEEAKELFIEKALEETHRLDELYLQHLKDLSSRFQSVRDDELRRAVSKFTGVVEASSLSVTEESQMDSKSFIFDKFNLPQVRWRNVVKNENYSSRLFEKRNFLQKHKIGDKGIVGGRESRFFYYWHLRFYDTGNKENEKILWVFTIDRYAVLDKINNSLSDELREDFEVLSKGTGLEVLIDGRRKNVFQSGKIQADREADEISLVKSRLGVWKLLSWNIVSEYEYFDYTSYGLCLLVGGALVVFGAWIHRKLTDAVRVAEQRVSFVNSVSHELSTPLTNVMLNLDLAVEALEEKELCYEKRLVAVGKEECSRLGRLIQNVLTFSKSNKKGSDLLLTEIKIANLLDGVVDNFKCSLERKRMSIKYMDTVDLTVVGSADAIQQIIGNLLSNAEKYGDKGSIVEVFCSESDSQVKIEVISMGGVIPSELKEKIFESYFRLQQKTTEGVAGAGIGLSISRHLAREMNGDLVCLPNGNKANFVLCLPKAKL